MSTDKVAPMCQTSATIIVLILWRISEIMILRKK